MEVTKKCLHGKARYINMTIAKRSIFLLSIKNKTMYKKRALIMLVMTMMIGIPITKADVQNVNFRFCDDTEGNDFMQGKKNFMLNPGEPMDLCLIFWSNADKPVQIIYGFTEGVIDPSGIQMCRSDKSATNGFSKYMTSKEPRSFILKKGENKTVHETVTLPLGMSGLQYGCIAYSLATAEWNTLEANNWGIFGIVVNKVFPISLFAGKSADIKNAVTLLETAGGSYTTNRSVKVTMDQNNNLILGFKVKNEGNISQDITLSGRIYNMFGFEKSFSATASRVGPGGEKDLETNVGVIPAYKGFFSIEYMMQNTPKFEFDTTNITEEAKKWGIVTGSAKVYLFSWISIGIVIVLLAIIVKLVRPRRKKVVVAQA